MVVSSGSGYVCKEGEEPYIIRAGDVVFPLGHRRCVGLVGDDHGEGERPGVGAGRGRGSLEPGHRVGAVQRIVDLARAAHH